MTLFCPTCHNLLHLGDGSEGMKFRCETCAYCFQIEEKVINKKYLHPKLADDAISARDELARNPKTVAVCPECNHNEAYFYQLQIRSGDESMTSFFQCTACNGRWRED